MLIFQIILEIINDVCPYRTIDIRETQKLTRAPKTPILYYTIHSDYLDIAVYGAHYQGRLIRYELHEDYIYTCSDTTLSYSKLINKAYINHPDFPAKILRAYSIATRRFNDRQRKYTPNYHKLCSSSKPSSK